MSDQLELWQKVLTASLVGTSRQPWQLPSTADAVTALLRDGAWPAPEAALLSAAAVLAIYQQAGQLAPVDAAPLPTPCPQDDRPRCGGRAAQHLDLIIDGPFKVVLPEWLRALAAAGLRVPEVTLPRLLDLAANQAALEPLLAPVLGERGRWLAGLNPAWSPAAARQGDPAEVWQTGKRAERLVALKQIHGHDAAQARELLAATWKSEKADDRAAFLEALGAGLTMDDEPFLEQCLDDRSREVRQQAAALLARLPESRLVGRMIERLLPLVSLGSDKKTQAPEIKVKLPKDCDRAMVRDGVVERPPHGTGERAWWFQQMLGVIPPGLWPSTLGLAPAALLQIHSEESPLLLEGWGDAARLHRDAEWALALLQIKPEWSDLLAYVPAAEREALAGAALESQRGHIERSMLAVPMLLLCEAPWSHRLARIVIRHIRGQIIASHKTHDYHLRSNLKELALRMPTDLAAEPGASWPRDSEHWPFWADHIEEFDAIVQFRHDMLKEIQL